MAPRRDLHAQAHRPGDRVKKERGLQLRMIADRCRHEQLQLLAYQLLPAVAEECLRLSIHHDDAAVGDHADNRVRDRLEERRKKRATERHPGRGEGHASGLSGVPRGSGASRGVVRPRPSALARFAFSA